VIEISRRIEIDAGHRVPDHASKCRSPHGHRYVIIATVTGDLYEEGPARGMVIDFGALKEAMMRAVHEPFDHAFICAVGDRLADVLISEGLADAAAGWKVVRIEDVPTAENLARIWFRAIRDDLAVLEPRLSLTQLEVRETPNCVAIYRP